MGAKEHSSLAAVSMEKASTDVPRIVSQAGPLSSPEGNAHHSRKDGINLFRQFTPETEAPSDDEDADMVRQLSDGTSTESRDGDWSRQSSPGEDGTDLTDDSGLGDPNRRDSPCHADGCCRFSPCREMTQRTMTGEGKISTNEAVSNSAEVEEQEGILKERTRSEITDQNFDCLQTAGHACMHEDDCLSSVSCHRTDGEEGKLQTTEGVGQKSAFKDDLREFLVEKGVESLGLKLQNMPPGPFVRVLSVDEGGWAEKHSIEPGSTVEKLNGKQARTMSMREFMKTIRDRPLRLIIKPPDDGRAFGGVLARWQLMRTSEASPEIKAHGQPALSRFRSARGGAVRSPHALWKPALETISEQEVSSFEPCALPTEAFKEIARRQPTAAGGCRTGQVDPLTQKLIRGWLQLRAGN